MRAKGLVSISGIVDETGKPVSFDAAIRYGWLPAKLERVPAGWGIGREEACLSKNLFLDNGRQLLAYAFGFRSPIQNYVCQNFGVGTGILPAKVTDIALAAPVLLGSGNYTGPVNSVDYLSAFMVRVSFTLGLGDANGFLLTEMGLFSGNSTLMARMVRAVGLNKVSTFSPTLSWRLRF